MALDDYGGRPYRCRSKRVGGRAASEFMACGETALRLVRGDAL